jgi:serine-type D-Ala-D-Ala carboxypeptidase/endopeptidase
MMKQLYGLVSLGIVISCMPPVSAQSAAADSPPPSIQMILDARTKSVPGSGIVAAVIDNGTVTTYISGSSGNARLLDEHTLFEIGSITKTFTATVLAKMVIAGKVKLSDPVSKYLPASIRVPSNKDGKEITLLNLATQHSGLPRLPSNMGDLSGPQPYETYTIEKLYAFLNGYTLTRDPGASFEYSNLGFGLLGYALARNAHTTYGNLVRQNVLEPLGMKETRVTDDAADDIRLSVGHDADGTAVQAWRFTDAFAGAGAIRSDLVDMIEYLRCNLGQGPLAKACLYAQQPRSTFPGHRIGLAWWTNEPSGFINHGGDTAGYHALVMVNGARTKGVVLLSNGPTVSDIGVHMLDPQYAVSEPVSLVLSDATLAEYAGTYANASLGLTYTIAPKDGKLYAKLGEQNAAVIYASRPDHFYYRIVSAYVEFIRQNGSIVGIILTQNGKHLQLYRIGTDGKPMTSALLPAYPPVVTLDPKLLASYVGIYAIRGEPVYTVTVKGGEIFFQVSGQPAFQIFPTAEDEMYFKVVDAQVGFHRDEGGNVTGLTLYQDGNNLEATRVP